MLPTCYTLWAGEALPPLPTACIASFVRRGHRVVLYAYKSIEVPKGVALRDAAQIMPHRHAGVHQGHGAIPVFSDWFRYELLARIDEGIWIDADLFCIRPVTMHSPYLFGYESEGRLGNAVLGLPAESQLLQKLRALFPGHRFIPPWFGPTRRLRYRIKLLFGAHSDVTTLPHGSSGPAALTWYATKMGAAKYALPREVFYPLECPQASRAVDGDLDLESIITPRTRCVHLWHNSIPAREPHPRSLIGRLLAGDLLTQFT